MYAFSFDQAADRRLPPSVRMLVCDKDTARQRSSIVRSTQLFSSRSTLSAAGNM